MIRFATENFANGCFRVLGLTQSDLHQRLAVEQPTVARLLAKTFVEGIYRGGGLASLVQSQGSVGVGFDLLAAPLIFLSAAAGAG